MPGFPLLADLAPHQREGVADRRMMPPATGFGILQVIVRPMPNRQPGELVHPPRLGVGDTRPQPVADMRLQLGNRVVHHVTPTSPARRRIARTGTGTVR